MKKMKSPACFRTSEVDVFRYIFRIIGVFSEKISYLCTIPKNRHMAENHRKTLSEISWKNIKLWESEFIAMGDAESARLSGDSTILQKSVFFDMTGVLEGNKE